MCLFVPSHLNELYRCCTVAITEFEDLVYCVALAAPSLTVSEYYAIAYPFLHYNEWGGGEGNEGRALLGLGDITSNYCSFTFQSTLSQRTCVDN